MKRKDIYSYQVWIVITNNLFEKQTQSDQFLGYKVNIGNYSHLEQQTGQNREKRQKAEGD